MKNFIKYLLTSSSKFAFVAVVIVSIGLLICLGYVMIYEVRKSHPIQVDFTGMAAFVTACAAIIGATGWTKVKSAKYRKEEDE
jgi:hypothetical protein